ncbi:hypothetical protein BKA93DRAFT_773597 [Sparassis latifolia]
MCSSCIFIGSSSLCGELVGNDFCRAVILIDTSGCCSNIILIGLACVLGKGGSDHVCTHGVPIHMNSTLAGISSCIPIGLSNAPCGTACQAFCVRDLKHWSLVVHAQFSLRIYTDFHTRTAGPQGVEIQSVVVNMIEAILSILLSRLGDESIKVGDVSLKCQCDGSRPIRGPSHGSLHVGIAEYALSGLVLIHGPYWPHLSHCHF